MFHRTEACGVGMRCVAWTSKASFEKGGNVLALEAGIDLESRPFHVTVGMNWSHGRSDVEIVCPSVELRLNPFKLQAQVSTVTSPR